MTPKEELRQRLLTDKLALARVLGYDFQEEPHKELFSQFMRLDRSKPLFENDPQKDRLILWSRGHFKTSAVVVVIVQLILNFPDVRILLMQSTVKNTKELLKEVKSHFDGTNHNSRLSEAFPEFCRERLGNSMGFTVPARKRMHLKEPTVYVASPKATKAGFHFDAAFFDDLVTEVNYLNPELQQKLIVDFSHYIPLIDPGGYRCVTGTRYTFGDLYEWIIRNNTKNRWHISIKGAWEVQPDGTRRVLFPRKTLKDGRSIGFTLELLDQIQRDNPETFSAQYLNQPIAAGKQEFTEDLLLRSVIQKDPTIAAGPAVLFVDLASSTKATADESVVLCARQVGRRGVVCDLRSGQWTTLQIANNILEMALVHRPLKVMIEGTPASTFFIDYLKVIAKDKGMSLQVEPLKVTNNKDAKHLRISAVAGALKTGRAAFLAGLPNWSDLVEQFLEFPKGRHDDKIDTVAMMVAFFSGQTAMFDPLPSQSLPFFLRTPGVDYGLEQQIVRTNDSESWVPIPEPSF